MNPYAEALEALKTTDPDLAARLDAQARSVPHMDHAQALKVLAWHYSYAPKNPGSGDPEFAAAFRAVVGHLLK